MNDGPASSGLSDELLDRVTAWIADDPDPVTAQQARAMLEAAVAAQRSGVRSADCAGHAAARLPAAADSATGGGPVRSQACVAHTQANQADGGSVSLDTAGQLTDAFGSWLRFGTAGLRGPLGPGPNRMNSAVVMRAAYSLGRFLLDHREHRAVGAVVVGFDARHGSTQFAHDTCAVLSGLGIPVMALPRALPTPVLAYAVRALDAAAGVMITASHNPASDNGYKVYLGARSGLPYCGSQLVPPHDEQIAAGFSRISQVCSLTLGDEWVTLDDDIVVDYLTACRTVTHPGGPRDVRVVHTALHGVAAELFLAAAAAAGFHDVASVAAQQRPDPDFPTVAFPNPEEPGALDLALAEAVNAHADLVVAHDPDADRCAVAVPTDRGWHRLSGDDVGLLLGWWRLEQHNLGWRPLPVDAVFAASLVSGSALALLCGARAVPHVRTLTGFKWLARVPHLAFAYEEALGYCVDPQSVGDKDGISAALAVMECAAHLKGRGISVPAHIDALRRELGAPVTCQETYPLTDAAATRGLLAALRGAARESLGGVPVTSVDDLERGVDGLPPTTGIRLRLADGSRVIIRPSGTEPKIKAYLESPDDATMRLLTADVRRLLTER